MKKLRAVALLVLGTLLVGLLAGCGNVRFTTNISERDLLKSDSETLSIGEAKLYLMTLTNEYKTLYDFNMWEKLEAAGNTAGVEELQAYVKNRTMERIQNVFCMYLLAKEKEITLTDSETTLISKAAEEFYNSLTEDELSYLEINQENVVTAYTHYTLANKLYEEMTGDEVNEISDDTARVMTGYMIYVTDEETADEIASKLSTGAEFNSLATMYTTLSSAIQNISRGAFPDAVVEAAFELGEGESTGKIEANGYYFVQCISRFDEELTEENRAVIERNLRETNFDQEYEDYLSTIYLQVSDDAWDEVEVRTDDAIAANNFFSTYNEYFPE